MMTNWMERVQLTALVLRRVFLSGRSLQSRSKRTDLLMPTTIKSTCCHPHQTPASSRGSMAWTPRIRDRAMTGPTHPAWDRRRQRTGGTWRQQQRPLAQGLWIWIRQRPRYPILPTMATHCLMPTMVRWRAVRSLAASCPPTHSSLNQPAVTCPRYLTHSGWQPTVWLQVGRVYRRLSRLRWVRLLRRRRRGAADRVAGQSVLVRTVGEWSNMAPPAWTQSLEASTAATLRVVARCTARHRISRLISAGTLVIDRLSATGHTAARGSRRVTNCNTTSSLTKMIRNICAPPVTRSSREKITWRSTWKFIKIA